MPYCIVCSEDVRDPGMCQPCIYKFQHDGPFGSLVKQNKELFAALAEARANQEKLRFNFQFLLDALDDEDLPILPGIDDDPSEDDWTEAVQQLMKSWLSCGADEVRADDFEEERQSRLGSAKRRYAAYANMDIDASRWNREHGKK